ncbi:MAG: phosphoribosylanthranilate isomerase [Pseudomonadota bacterium]
MANTIEAQMAAAAGADLIGLVGPMPTGPGVLSLEQCTEIAATVPDGITTVLLSSADTADEIARQVRQTGVRAVQLVRHVPQHVHQRLKELIPNCHRIQVIHVEGPDAVDLIRIYETDTDAFLLDSGQVNADRLGGTGCTHDWSISAAFVQATDRPVYLAGGLTPENVLDALDQVKPFGLDICSGLRTHDKLDPTKVATFMARVKLRQRGPE